MEGFFNYSMMKILITGGSGFIGTNLQKLLVGEGYEVRVFDLKHSDRNLTDDVIIGDVRNYDEIADAVAGCDYVIHLAAEHTDNVKPLDLYYQVNVTGTTNLVKAMDCHGVKNIIFTSSSAVYPLFVEGDPSEDTPPAPFNPYGESKFNAEQVLRDWYKNGDGKQLIIIRPCVVFGEHNRGNIYLMLQQIYQKRFIVVGDGKNLKSVNYVGNIVCFMQYVIENLDRGNYLFNYVDKPDLSTGQMISIAKKAMGRSASVGFRCPYWIGLCGGYCFDLLSRITGKTYPVSSIRIKKFRVSLCFDNGRAMATGFKPPYSLEEAFKRTVEFEFGGNR